MRNTKMLLTGLTATAALTVGSADAALISANQIFQTADNTTEFFFDDGISPHLVKITAEYETGNLAGFQNNSSQAVLVHPSVGLGPSNTNQTTITFDLPVNLSPTFSSLNLGEEFFADDVAESSITLDTRHSNVISGTGSIPGFTRVTDLLSNSTAETTGTVVTWNNITSLTLLNGRNAGSTAQAQILGGIDVVIVSEPGSLPLLGLCGLLIAMRHRRHT